MHIGQWRCEKSSTRDYRARKKERLHLYPTRAPAPVPGRGHDPKGHVGPENHHVVQEQGRPQRLKQLSWDLPPQNYGQISQGWSSTTFNS